MEDLIVVTYRNQYSAVDNIRTLRKLDDDWVVDIHDAVAVARDSYGKLYIQDSYKATSQSGARWGVLLGMLLGGLALAPFTGGLSTTAAAGATRNCRRCRNDCAMYWYRMLSAITSANARASGLSD